MTDRYPDDAPAAPWALLARHLAAEATASERQALRDWVQADPAHLQLFTAATQAWERAGEAAPAPAGFSATDVEGAWQRFRPLLASTPAASTAATTQGPSAALAASGQDFGPANTPPLPAPATSPPGRFRWPLQRRGWRRWQLVAGLALLFGAGYWLRGWLARPADTVATYATAGTRQQVRLPDGSAVWLNAHSRLRYAGAGPGAGTGPRTVQLSGEAYFEVVHNPARPFFVTTATAQVRVTGTAFNVRAFAAEDSVDVAVTQGRVWVRRLALARPDSVLLVAGTRAAVRAADAPGSPHSALRRTATDGSNARAWQTDTLRFADASVAQVLRTLQLTFGTSVRLAGAGLGRCRFTGTFARPRPGQVLAVLAATTGSHLRTDGPGGYALEGPGCGAEENKPGDNAAGAGASAPVPTPASAPAPAAPRLQP